MKSIVFLALVAAAVAHFPYADLEDKFRMSSLIIGGSGNAIVSTPPDVAPFAWYFSPINNQLLPTFQLRFPNQAHASHPVNPATRHPEGIIYTVALDHIAEVLPGSATNSRTYTIVTGSTISLSTVSWYFEDTYWWYDEEYFGEVITFSLVPWSFDWEEEDLRRDVHCNLLDNWLDTAIWLSIYPDSLDDLVDISVWLDGYRFLDGAEGQHVALFWKLISSVGEKPNHRNLPLSLDYTAMTFELNSDVLVSSGSVKRPLNRAAPRATESHRKGKIVTRKVMQKIADAISDKKAAGKRHAWTDKRALKHTTGQIWLTGGYVATVIGLVPEDVPDRSQLFITVTLSLRPERS
jgi:hypothetical protein